MKYFIPIIFSVLILSCSKEQISEQIIMPDGCDSTAFTFEKNVNKIFISNCNFFECHGSGGSSGFDYSKYPVVANRIRAGTLAYRLDLPFEDPQHMPRKMRLSSCDYFIIKTWISQGYPEK